MTPPVTSIDAAADAIVAGLTPRIQALGGALANIKVRTGEAPQEPSKREVWVDPGVPDWRQRWEATGPTGDSSREETYTLSVYFLVARAGNDLKAPRDEVVSMMQALSDLVRADATLGGAVFQAEVEDGTMGAGRFDTYRFFVGHVGVAVTAYLA